MKRERMRGFTLSKSNQHISAYSIITTVIILIFLLVPVPSYSADSSALNGLRGESAEGGHARVKVSARLGCWAANPKAKYGSVISWWPYYHRARNELGLAIAFRPGHEPETLIKPSPSSGYSGSHFALADIKSLLDSAGLLDDYHGLLVYLKSSLKAPNSVKKTESVSHLYKTQHPAFPHETTAD